MVTYETKITISRPVKHVYDLISDQKRATEWITSLKKIVPLSETSYEKGAKSKYLFFERGKEITFIEEIINIVPYSNFSFRLESDQVEMETETHLKPVNGNTEVLMINSVKGKGFFMKLILPLMKGTMAKRQKQDLSNLKALAERVTT